MKPMEVYIRAEYFSKLSKKQVVIIYQVFRIINSLEFKMLRSHHAMSVEQDEMFKLRIQIEHNLELMSSYKEATKEFGNNLAEELLAMNLSDGLRAEIRNYKGWLDDWKTDPYLQVVDRVRNCLTYHLTSSIYDDCINDGEQTDDIMIGYAVGDTYADFMYAILYPMQLKYMCAGVPESVGSGQDALAWVNQRSAEETDKFLSILRRTAYELLIDNIYKKERDSIT